MTLPEQCVEGASFRVNYGRGNPNNRLFHVRGEVDGRAIVRTWRTDKVSWRYEIWSAVDFWSRRDVVRWGKVK